MEMEYKIVNLKLLMDEVGEDTAKSVLSDFYCPLNRDVEMFLRTEAVDFAKQGLSQTHLVMAPRHGQFVLAGYFTLANKYISVPAETLSNTQKKRLAKFSIFDNHLRAYCLSAPLIAQLGKNCCAGYDRLITGDELLCLACRKVASVQMDIGGRYAYLECEDKPKLMEFYTRNGFQEFDRRSLDEDETGLDGEYLVQMLKYIKDSNLN